MKKKRAPIVTVLGHVDHGKTTLLDVIRKTNVASREAGGITQGIGASKIKTSEGEITFIDTPGHAAFAKMRERGVKLADISLLVVAADDGVKPQTEEALDYLKKSKTPFIVVLTKTDLPSADAEEAKGELMEKGVMFEEVGGDVPSIAVSAKKNKGIEDLIEMIHLVADVNEIKADEKGSLEAVVVETNKDKRGPTAMVVVREGELKVGDEIEAGGEMGKVKGMFDEGGNVVKRAGPGDPAMILGFSELPEVGVELKAVDRQMKKLSQMDDQSRADIKRDIGEGEMGIVLKVASAGSLEAIRGSLPKEVVVLEAGVGDVTEADVFLAKAAGAWVVAFESKAQSAVRKLAETEGVRIETFKIIYELIEKLEEEIEGKKEKVLARALILKVFEHDKKKVAGCRVEEGEIGADEKLVLKRGDEVLGKVKVVSMRKQKQVVEKVGQGEECGILFVPNLDFEEGDVLVSLNK